MNELIANIKKLQESGVFDEPAQAEFNNWKSQIEHEQAKEGLVNNLIIQEYLEDCKRQVFNIDAELISDIEMEGPKRIRLIDKRRCYKEMIQKFEINEVEIESIKKEINDNLTQI